MAEATDDIDDLIGKVLAGEATREEQQRLAEWSSMNEENSQYLSHIKTIFEKATSQRVQMQFDEDAAWAKVKQRLGHTEPSRIVFLDSVPTFMRVAAGVIFLLGVGLFAYLFLKPVETTFAVATEKTTIQDTLPDGSTAFLNKRTSLAYEYNSSEKTRKVKLQGEGFFDVRHEAEKPFVIEAQDVLVRDIGTSFNVRAYPESDTVEVVVLTGEVQVYTSNDAGLHLGPGESGIYLKKLRQFSKLEKADTNVLAYKTGILSFNNTYLKTIIENINELYDSQIKLDNPALGSCRLTVNFHGDSLETIVDVIAETLNLKVTRNGNEIVLTGQACN